MRADTTKNQTQPTYFIRRLRPAIDFALIDLTCSDNLRGKLAAKKGWPTLVM
jgi:hypothetical protein